MAKSDVEIKLGLDSSGAEADAKSAGKSIGDKAGSGVEEGLDSGSKSGAKKAAANVDDGKIKQAGKSAGDGAGKGIGDGIGEGTKDGVKKAEDAISDLSGKLETALSFVGVGAGVAGFFELIQNSAESSFSKVEAAAQSAGTSFVDALGSYQNFVGITGDAEQATEAVNNAFRLCQDNTEELAAWTDIAAGTYATLGDSLPIENLTEAANETARTGVVVGGMADALNWATLSTDEWRTALGDHAEAQTAFNAALDDGMSAEDAFNEALLACNDEQERGQLITDTLSNIYSEAGQSYLEANAATIEYNKEQDRLNRTLAEAGSAIMPFGTALITIATDIINLLLPGIESIGDALNSVIPFISEAMDELSSNIFIFIDSIAQNDEVQRFGELIAAIATSALDAAANLSWFGDSMEPPDEAFTAALGVVNDVLQWIYDNGDAVSSVIVAIAAGFAAMQVVSAVATGIQTMSTAIAAVKAALDGASAAQLLFNSVLAANPIAAVIAILAALVAGLVYFFTQTQTGQQIWAQFTSFLSAAATTISTALMNAAQWIQDKWNSLTSFMMSIPGKIQGFFSGLPGWFSSTFDNISRGIQNGFNSAVNFVSSIPGRIKGFFSDAGSWLLSSGKALLDGFTNGIRNGFSSAVNAVKNGLSTLRSFFPFSPAKRGPFSGHGYTTYSGRAIMRDLGKGMTEGAKDAKSRAEDALASVQASFEAPISSRVSVAGATNNSRAYSVTFGDVTTGGDDRTAQAVERFFTDLGIIERTGAY